MRSVVISANSGGGLILSPRPMLMAHDMTISEAASVAMIGGIRRIWIRPALASPTAAPARMAASNPGRIMAFCPSMTSIATALASAIEDGMERSAFPGPVEITSICPRAASTVSAEKLSAAPSNPVPEADCPPISVRANAAAAAIQAPIQG